jgi:hypothetical protein
MAAQSVNPIKIFYCYDHQDGKLREILEKHLVPLRRRRDITTWVDMDIQAGLDWREVSVTHLAEAELILLLLSSDFMASWYSKAEDILRALERHKAGRARVIPILLRPVLWEITPLGILSPLPVNRKPVTLWENQDQAFFEIAQGIELVVQEMLQERHTSAAQQSPSADQATPYASGYGPASRTPAPSEPDLAEYTVQLHVARRGEYSTGFFIAPDLLLTCARAVQTAHKERLPVSVRWKGTQYLEAWIVAYNAETASHLAILKLIGSTTHDYLTLSQSITPGDSLVAYGYCGRNPTGERLSDLTCIGQPPQVLQIASHREIPCGFSGAPLYNQRTRAVCGVIVLPDQRHHISECQAISVSQLQEHFREFFPPA